MSSLRKDQGNGTGRDHGEFSFAGCPSPLLAETDTCSEWTAVSNVPTPDLPGSRPSSSTSKSNASVNGVSTTHAAVSGTSTPPVAPGSGSSSHSHTQSRPLDFKNTDLYRKLKASKVKRGSRLNPQPVPRPRPDANGIVNPIPAPLSTATAGHADMEVDTDSPSPAPMAGSIDPDLPLISAQPMDGVEPTAATASARSALPGVQITSVTSQNIISRTTSVATRAIVPQNRVASPGPRIVIRGLGNAMGKAAAPSVTPPSSTTQPSVQPSAPPSAVDIVRGLIATEEHITSADPVEIIDEGPASPPARTPSRSPSFEILDQDTYIQKTASGKKRKLATTVPADVAAPSEPVRLPATSKVAQSAPDLLGQEVELLNGIEENAEAVSSELLASLLEDEEMASTASANDLASKPTTQVAAPVAAPMAAVTSAQIESRIAGWSAPRDQASKPFNSLIDAVNMAASAYQSTSTSASTSSSSSVARAKKTSGPAISSSLASNANSSTASAAVERVHAQAPVFKVPHPVSMSIKGKEPVHGSSAKGKEPLLGVSAKGKEPVRSREPFERKASPPLPQASTVDRQELWKKEGAALNAGRMPKDVDSMLHNADDEDDPFLAVQQVRNAVAGPSFKHPEVTDKAYIHMLPEPRGADSSMTKEFDYRKFDDPLLDCINSLPEHAQNPAHIRVILEAYYSQSTLDRAPAIKIDGGDYDEYPPPEFKYSDEVYYSEKVPKPWLGKGCECVGPCSENSECFCLKRQEMYFASYVTDAVAGPLKGFAYNE